MKKKKPRTPEQKAKLNKLLFSAFMTLVFLACVGVGVWRWVGSVNFDVFSNLDAYQTLKDDKPSITQILSFADLLDNDILEKQSNEVSSALLDVGIDVYTDGQLDNTKWNSDHSPTANFELSDIQVSILAREFCPNLRAMSIRVESGNQYAITAVDYVRLYSYSPETQHALLPEFAYITTKTIVKSSGQSLEILSAKVIAYNQVTDAKADTITASMSSSISRATSNIIVNTLNTLAEKSDSNIVLSDKKCMFVV